MKLETHQTLWNNILQFQLDDPAASLTFSQKLASQNNWSAEFTIKAILEYKKFIFLCCISPTGASPSPVVDEVWHLHLTYTHNYWKEFCAKTLNKEIHHHPSKGGSEEKEKHRVWYAQTLSLYEEVFRESPPADIWPQPERSGNGQHSLSDLPAINYFTAYKKHFPLLLIPFLFPLLFAKFHPFALTGPLFLIFYGLLITAGIVFIIKSRNHKRQLLLNAINNTPIQTANIYAIARFVYGKNKAIETAIVDLVAKGILETEQQNKFRFCPDKMTTDTLVQNPLAANILHSAKADNVFRMEDMASFYNEDLTYHQGLASFYKQVSKKDYIGFFIAIAIILFGLIRIKQGITNHYPVTYLQIMLVAGGLILLGFAITLSTRKLFQSIFMERHKEQEFAFSAPEPLLSKFVFLGIGALAGSYAFANLEGTFKQHKYSDASGSYVESSGCGSSCGASCGGGGCGGCGGGD